MEQERLDGPRVYYTSVNSNDTMSPETAHQWNEISGAIKVLCRFNYGITNMIAAANVKRSMFPLDIPILENMFFFISLWYFRSDMTETIANMRVHFLLTE